VEAAVLEPPDAAEFVAVFIADGSSEHRRWRGCSPDTL